MILFSFLAAMGVGALVVGLLDRHGLLSRRTCALVQVGAGLMGLISICLLAAVRPAVGLSDAGGSALAAYELRELGYSLMVMSGPVLLFGLNLPLLVRLAHREVSKLGRELGGIYLLNTIGSVAAPLVVGFLVLPMVGLKQSLMAIAWAGVLFGVFVLLPWSRREGSRSAAVGILSLVAAGLATVLLPGDLRLWQGSERDRLLEYREGVSASVAVVANQHGDRLLKLNNHYSLGSTRARFAQQRQGLIPLLLHRDPQRCLFLGVGTGSSAGAAAAYGDVSIDALEIVPEVAGVLHHFASINCEFMTRVASDPDVRLLPVDARHFVRATSRRYDVVVGDLFVPWHAGEGAMFTREHFEAVRDVLNPGGFFCQWLPLYQLGADELKIVIATFCDVFPRVGAWWLYFNVEMPAIGLVGSIDPFEIDTAALDRRVADPVRRQLLDDAGLTEVRPLLGSWICDRGILLDACGGAPLETRDRPRIEFIAPLQRLRPSTAIARENIDGMLVATERFREGGSWTMQSAPAEFAGEIFGYQRAVAHYLRGQTSSMDDQLEQAFEKYHYAVKAAPDWALATGQLAQSVQWAFREFRLDLARSGAEALKKSPHAAHWGHYFSALAAFKDGELGAATESARAALQIDPNHRPSQELLRRIEPRDR